MVVYNMNLVQIGWDGIGWIILPRNRDYWSSVVKAAVKRRVP
jgi:hypothetical protein